MILIIKLYAFILNFIYIFFKFNKTKKKVFLLSRQSDKPSVDFKLIEKELKKSYSDYEVTILTKKINKNLYDFLIVNQLLLFKQMYHLSTSELCIIDGYNMYVSILKHKKSLQVVQIWHALGAVKKFGKQIINSKYQACIYSALKHHKNYTYLIAPSTKTAEIYSESFSIDIDKIVQLGLPRIDNILDKGKSLQNKIYKVYPEFINKTIILYAPTFRENSHYEINELIEEITENQILIFKKHSLIKEEIKSSKKNIYSCPEFSSYDLLKIADYVVTDYSAFSIEASLLNKALLFYVYDYDEYKKYPGLNIDLYKSFPTYTFKDPKKLIKELSKNNYNYQYVEKYKKEYISVSTKGVTKKLVKYMMEKIK